MSLLNHNGFDVETSEEVDVAYATAIEQAETSRGNEGVTWVGGGNAGGSGQRPIRVVSDVTRAGYNLVNGRDVDDTSSIDPSSCAGNLTCQTWSSPAAGSGRACRVTVGRTIRPERAES